MFQKNRESVLKIPFIKWFPNLIILS